MTNTTMRPLWFRDNSAVRLPDTVRRSEGPTRPPLMGGAVAWMNPPHLLVR